MFHDYQNELSAKQAITVDAVSTHTYDLNAVGYDPSMGRALTGLVAVTTAAAGTVVATSYGLQVIQSAAADLSSPDVIASRTVTGASCTVDTMFEIPIPHGSITKRYIGFNYDVTGGTAPTVSFSSYIVPFDEVPKSKAFTKVYTTI